MHYLVQPERRAERRVSTSEASPHVSRRHCRLRRPAAARARIPDQSRNWLLTTASPTASPVDGVTGDKDSAASREAAKKKKVKKAKKKVKKGKQQ